ncbi:MAG: glycosyltransferase family 2 protein [Vicinamibacterales bacterium]
MPNEPHLSLIMPCYNEEESIPYSVPRLIRAFEREHYRLQLITVDNGSRDRTWELIQQFKREHPDVITPVQVATNIGFGNGILSGISSAVAPWVGTVAADGQVDPEDLVRLFEAATATDGMIVAKVRRRFRMDGFIRKIISVAYNGFVWTLWPRLGSLDVNGQPRLMRREVLLAMRLSSTNWLLDPEMLVKAHYLGVRVLELNVFARMRGNGLSHVRMSTCWEFFTHLIRMRFSNELSEWRKSAVPPVIAPVPRAQAPHTQAS